MLQKERWGKDFASPIEIVNKLFIFNFDSCILIRGMILNLIGYNRAKSKYYFIGLRKSNTGSLSLLENFDESPKNTEFKTRSQKNAGLSKIWTESKVGLSSIDDTLKVKDSQSSADGHQENLIVESKKVTFSESVIGELKGLIEHKKLDDYKTVDELMKGIKTVLNNNHDRVETQTPVSKITLYAVAMKNLMVLYTEKDNGFEVLKTSWSTHFEETNTKPSKSWLDTLCIVLNLI